MKRNDDELFICSTSCLADLVIFLPLFLSLLKTYFVEFPVFWPFHLALFIDDVIFFFKEKKTQNK